MLADLSPWIELATPLLFGVFLIFARLATLFMWLPGLASGVVPLRVRIGAAMVFAAVLEAFPRQLAGFEARLIRSRNERKAKKSTYRPVFE